MGLKERIDQLLVQQEEERERLQREETVRRQEEYQVAQERQSRRSQKLLFELPDRFLQELPEALAKQQQLFDELQLTGLIDMIAEMATVSRPRGFELYEHRIRGARGDRDHSMLFPERPPIDEDKDWVATVKLLEMSEEDGTVKDPSLQIDINRIRIGWSGLGSSTSWPGANIAISYSQDRVLTIRGAETTFEQTMGDANFVSSTIETALAQAFINPAVPKDNGFREPRHTGIRPSLPQPRF